MCCAAALGATAILTRTHEPQCMQKPAEHIACIVLQLWVQQIPKCSGRMWVHVLQVHLLLQIWPAQDLQRSELVYTHSYMSEERGGGGEGAVRGIISSLGICSSPDEVHQTSVWVFQGSLPGCRGRKEGGKRGQRGEVGPGVLPKTSRHLTSVD